MSRKNSKSLHFAWILLFLAAISFYLLFDPLLDERRIALRDEGYKAMLAHEMNEMASNNMNDIFNESSLRDKGEIYCSFLKKSSNSIGKGAPDYIVFYESKIELCSLGYDKQIGNGDDVVCAIILELDGNNSVMSYTLE